MRRIAFSCDRRCKRMQRIFFLSLIIRWIYLLKFRVIPWKFREQLVGGYVCWPLVLSRWKRKKENTVNAHCANRLVRCLRLKNYGEKHNRSSRIFHTRGNKGNGDRLFNNIFFVLHQLDNLNICNLNIIYEPRVVIAVNRKFFVTPICADFKLCKFWRAINI